MNKILIFGLNGLLGWHLFLEAKKESDAFGTYRRYLPEFEGHRFHRVDLRNKKEIESLLQEICPEIIFHAWSMCDLDVCESNPKLAYEINVEGTKTILEAAENVKSVRKFVYISTDHVFDGEDGPYVETDAPSPKHVYGETKLKAEELVEKSGLSTLIIRPGLVIGASVQGNKGPRDFLISRLKAGKPTRYFTDEFRTPVRAKNFAQATVRLALGDEKGVFHVTGCKKWSRFELAKKIAKSLDVDAENITSCQRVDDEWSAIRPKDLSLKSNYLKPFEDFL